MNEADKTRKELTDLIIEELDNMKAERREEYNALQALTHTYYNGSVPAERNYAENKMENYREKGLVKLEKNKAPELAYRMRDNPPRLLGWAKSLAEAVVKSYEKPRYVLTENGKLFVEGEKARIERISEELMKEPDKAEEIIKKSGYSPGDLLVRKMLLNGNFKRAELGFFSKIKRVGTVLQFSIPEELYIKSNAKSSGYDAYRAADTIIDGNPDGVIKPPEM